MADSADKPIYVIVMCKSKIKLHIKCLLLLFRKWHNATSNGDSFWDGTKANCAATVQPTYNHSNLSVDIVLL